MIDPPPPTRVVAAERRTGRTYALAAWLLGGHQIAGPRNMWSRILIVPTPERADLLAAHHPDLEEMLRASGAGGFARVTLTTDQVQRLRGYDRSKIEFAVDDVESLIYRALGHIWPAVLSLEGVPATIAEIRDEGLAAFTPAPYIVPGGRW